MVDIAKDDICRYYGDTRPVNSLSGVDGRNSAQPALTAWAADKPAPIRNIVSSLTAQLWLARRYPDCKALRAIVAKNIKRLGVVQ